MNMLHLRRSGIGCYLALVSLGLYKETAQAWLPGNAIRNRPLSPSKSLFSVNGDDDATGESISDSTNSADLNDFLSKASKISQPTKTDLYGEDELADILQLHLQLQSTMMPASPSEPPTDSETATPEASSPPNDPFAGGLHDLILQTVEKIEDQAKAEKAWISKEAKEKFSKLTITAVASDVDGTIIGSDQTVHPKTIRSIQAAQKSSKLEWVLPATGKTRWGARNSLGPELSGLTDGPGVYNQGLYCLGKNGEVVFEKKLTASSLAAAEELVVSAGIAVVAYDGDEIYSTDLSRIEVIELHTKWGEPASKEISSLLDHGPGFHKLLLMDDDTEKLKQDVRPLLEKMAKENGSVVTQAIPTMLELLPAGCSKALGVQKVCEHLGIDPETQLLTLGDAENDVGMLEMSAIGVAVANAGSEAKNAADIVLPLTSTEGGVGMALDEILEI